MSARDITLQNNSPTVTSIFHAFHFICSVFCVVFFIKKQAIRSTTVITTAGIPGCPERNGKSFILTRSRISIVSLKTLVICPLILPIPPVKRRFQSCPACDRDSARKILHANVVSIKFHATFSIWGSFHFSYPVTRSKTMHRPWSAPQTRKVQFVPCQKPLNKKIIMILSKVLAVPFRLHPSGIYTYRVKNLVNVICQRSQNSDMEAALYGE